MFICSMNKLQIILLVLLNLLVHVYFGQAFTIEPYAGFNQTPLPKTFTGTNYKMSFEGGILGKYHVTDELSVNLGVGISDRRKQYKYSDTAWALEQYRPFLVLAGIDPDEIDSTLSALGFNFDQITQTNGIAKIPQLEIPVSVRYNWKKVNFELGGYLGFNLSVKKYEIVESEIPLLQSVDISQIDSSGTLALFFPPAYSVSENLVRSDENISALTYGIRFAFGYSPDSYLRFYGAFCLDLNKYKIQTPENLLDNHKYFFRIGLSYDIKSLRVNKDARKASFD